MLMACKNFWRVGMVLTSQRAVEAMELCVTNFISHEGEAMFCILTEG